MVITSSKPQLRTAAIAPQTYMYVQEHCPGETGSFRQFSRPFWLDCLLQRPQQVGTVFSIDSFAFLKVVNEHNAFCIPEDGDHSPSLPMTPPWPSLEGDKRGVSPGCFYCMDCRLFGLWLEVEDPTLILGENTFKKTGWICCKKCQLSSPATWPWWQVIGVLFFFYIWNF